MFSSRRSSCLSVFAHVRSWLYVFARGHTCSFAFVHALVCVRILFAHVRTPLHNLVPACTRPRVFTRAKQILASMQRWWDEWAFGRYSPSKACMDLIRRFGILLSHAILWQGPMP